ncbi:MAG TPA: hypothetical protein VE377_09175 [Candidatus Dormibacteraeota bacterium]|nr:hypothetical protein [Candidatus Dormibacteraeota bacterium]
MEKRKPNRGKDSFTVEVRLKDGEACNWKRHYRHCAREVIGYLDRLANNDEERFVYVTVPGIVKHCNRYKSKKSYKERAVGYVISLLQKQFVLSEQVERFRKGTMRWGWLVAPHDVATLQEENRCDFKGQRHWEREIKTERQPDGNWKVSSIGPVRWMDFASGKPIASQLPAAAGYRLDDVDDAPENDGVQGSVQPSVQSENAKCAVKCAVSPAKPSPQTVDDEAACTVGVRANRGSRGQSAVVSVETVITKPAKSSGQAEDAGKGNTNPNSKTGRVDGAEEKGVNDKTIGQHFDVALHPGFGSITAGLLNTKTEAWGRFAGADNLLLICWDVLTEFSAQPYLGRKTHALIMSLAMQRFNAAHGDVPTSWLKVLNDLKRGS